MHFAGMQNGNLFLSIQPPRGYLENVEKIYHDMYLSPPHHYLAQYRWIRDVFKADAVMHVGKHGSLEWLPGKALGLSEKCYPDLAIMELPNIYPYIINDPGEGTQAKRRSYACIIDHLTPATTNADLYDDLEKVNGLMADYTFVKAEDPAKREILEGMIWEAVAAADLHKDLEMNEDEAKADFEEFMERLHAYLEDLSDTMINDGLHIMGDAPQGMRLVEFLVQLTRLPNGSVPSLREALISAKGFDYDDVLENKGKRLSRFGNQTGGEIIREAHDEALLLVEALFDTDFNPDAVDDIVSRIVKTPRVNQTDLTTPKNANTDTTDHWSATGNDDVVSVLRYIADTLVLNIRQCTDEIHFSLHAFSGGFVPPGPSGAPSRGQADILPTGRNFFSVDPNKIPTPAAWEVGMRLGDALLERYLDESGKYPDSVGILVYGSPTMRTRGDDIAEIYYLMGLKPLWQKGSGNVSGLEVIPLSELTLNGKPRPRIDVVPRVSGFFRDSFPNIMERIDAAVQMVASLQEPPESNMLRRNVYKDVDEYKARGMSEEEAFREATFRVFGCPPGTYGAGVAELVESKNWESQEDLGNNYIRYSSHAYGKGSYGTQKPENFRKMLSRMDVTVKNEDSREYDMMSCTDYYNYYGGLIVAAKTVRGALPFAVMGDSADPKRVKMRTTFEEAKHVLRSRLVNPKWLQGMKRHGYKGAGDISHMMDVVLGWDATARSGGRLDVRQDRKRLCPGSFDAGVDERGESLCPSEHFRQTAGGHQPRHVERRAGDGGSPSGYLSGNGRGNRRVVRIIQDISFSKRNDAVTGTDFPAIVLLRLSFFMMGLCFCAVTLLPSWALASGNGSGDEESIIVTESEIQAIKAHKMADLLNHVPGVTAGDTSVSIHGSYKVKVLVNGRSINDPDIQSWQNQLGDGLSRRGNAY